MNKKSLIICLTILLSSLGILFSQTLGMHYYEKLDFVTGLVTASKLNVRSGPRFKLFDYNTS